MPFPEQLQPFCRYFTGRRWSHPCGRTLGFGATLVRCRVSPPLESGSLSSMSVVPRADGEGFPAAAAYADGRRRPMGPLLRLLRSSLPSSSLSPSRTLVKSVFGVPFRRRPLVVASAPALGGKVLCPRPASALGKVSPSAPCSRAQPSPSAVVALLVSLMEGWTLR